MRMLSQQDLEITSGKGQIFFGSGSSGNALQYNMNNEISLIIASLWVCTYNCESKGATAYTEDMGNLILDYIVGTNFVENFDLDGKFLNAIPEEVAAYWEQGPLKGSGPMWAPASNAPRQRSKTVPAAEE